MQGLIDAADEHLFKGREFKTQVSKQSLFSVNIHIIHYHILFVLHALLFSLQLIFVTHYIALQLQPKPHSMSYFLKPYIFQCI